MSSSLSKVIPSGLSTSLLLMETDETLVAKVIGAEATATTYVLNCLPDTDGNECGTYDNTITLGPWASETLPSGAAETGNFDMYITDSIDPWQFSLHCEMTRTAAMKCTTTNIGGNDDGSPTATFTSPEEIESFGLGKFDYVHVIVTAGQELLDATHAASESSGASKSAEATGAAASGSTTGTAASPEKTSNAASPLVRVFAALSVAGVATLLAFW